MAPEFWELPIHWGFIYIYITPIMENQMEKKMENEMEAGVI